MRAGVGIVDVINAWSDAAPDGSFAEWRFGAPPGTAIVEAAVTRDIGNRDEWTPYGRIDGVDQPGESCMPGMGEAFCRIQGRRVFSGLNARTIAYGVRCVVAPYCAHGATLRSVWALVLGATVTLDDREAPAVSSLDVDGRWWRGGGAVSFTAEDNTGIRRRRVVVDGVTRVVVDAPGAALGGCGDLGAGPAYSHLRPCADGRGLNGLRSLAVEPCRWGDGAHSVRGGATDTGGLDGLSAVASTMRVDCTPPAVSVGRADAEVPAGEVVEPVVVAGDPTSGLGSVVVEVSVDGGAWSAAGAGVVAEGGRSYVFRARAVDVAGNWSGWVAGPPVLGTASAEVPVGEEPEEEPDAPPVVVPPVDVLREDPPPGGATLIEKAPPHGEGDGPREGAAPPSTPPAVRPAGGPAMRDPRLRITRVIRRRRGRIEVAGTAARDLEVRAALIVRTKRRVLRRRVVVAHGRWRATLRAGRGQRVRSVEVASAAAAGFRDGVARWRR